MSSSDIIVRVIREKDWDNAVKLLRSPDAYYHATQLYPMHEDQRRHANDDINGSDNPSSILASMVSSSSSSLSPSRTTTKEEYVPLINMCSEHEETSLLLLELDPEPLSMFTSQDTGDTCLHTACKNANKLSVKTLDKMLSIAPGALTRANKDNELPFHCTLASGGSLEIVQMVCHIAYIICRC